jgi:hypothetical protein
MTGLTTAWQAALAAEQQAAFGYGLLGPQLPAAEQGLARTCGGAHEVVRDTTASAIAGAGEQPVPPAADYPDLYPVASAGSARLLALHLEDSCARAWRYLYLQAASSRSHRSATLRETSQRNLTASAVRGAQWRRLITPQHPSTPFPGL